MEEPSIRFLSMFRGPLPAVSKSLDCFDQKAADSHGEEPVRILHAFQRSEIAFGEPLMQETANPSSVLFHLHLPIPRYGRLFGQFDILHAIDFSLVLPESNARPRLRLGHGLTQVADVQKEKWDRRRIAHLAAQP